MSARCLVQGTAQGDGLKLDDPLSFWGGFDSASGKVIDRFHPQHGACLSGTILFMERGRGSSSGASVLAEAIRLGTAPAALVLLDEDAIITTGALVAQMLYGIDCPVVAIRDKAEWQKLSALPRLLVKAGADEVVVTPQP
ncbi:aconitase X swivel domain-containing protein [Hoeflea sp.]|uniref:aconitase X swivel domain-containing protein n=1 Tax=Hoeflea sp. TaxID=1940281 RepID=UPI003A8D3CDE